MNIGFFHHTLRIGSGIDTVIYELASRLSLKANVTVFCFATDYTDDARFQIRTLDSWLVKSRNRTMTIAPFLVDKMGGFRRELETQDVINTHHYPANFICRNLKNPLKIVTEWSGVTASMFSTFREKTFIAWAKYANKVAAKRADVLVAPCDFVSKWIIKTYSLDSTTMFLDGVNFELFDRNRISSNEFFKLFPELKGKKIILFVGRITESKNIHTLVEVFVSIKKQVPDSALVLVGDNQSYPSYYRKLKGIISLKKIQDVVFAGIVPWKALPSFFASCNVYATCSLWEGFLRAEAFAFGKPIICFNAGANYETVRNAENGFIIDNLDTSEFIKRTISVLDDPREATKLGENGYNWAKNNLDFDVIADRFLVLCQEKANKND